MTSLDGEDWTSRTSGTGKWLAGIAWSGSLFVAVGETGFYSETILTSADGFTWSEN